MMRTFGNASDNRAVPLVNGASNRFSRPRSDVTSQGNQHNHKGAWEGNVTTERKEE